MCAFIYIINVTLVKSVGLIIELTEKHKVGFKILSKRDVRCLMKSCPLFFFNSTSFSLLKSVSFNEWRARKLFSGAFKVLFFLQVYRQASESGFTCKPLPVYFRCTMTILIKMLLLKNSLKLSVVSRLYCHLFACSSFVLQLEFRVK